MKLVLIDDDGKEATRVEFDAPLAENFPYRTSREFPEHYRIEDSISTLFSKHGSLTPKTVRVGRNELFYTLLDKFGTWKDEGDCSVQAIAKYLLYLEQKAQKRE